MARLVLLAVLVGLVVIAFRLYRRRQAERAFIWRPESITARVLRDDDALRIGQYLNLDQKLQTHESGWTNMKLDIPEHWTVQSIDAVPDGIILKLHSGEQFFLNRANVGRLSSGLLDGGVKPDAELERLWHAYARIEAA